MRCTTLKSVKEQISWKKPQIFKFHYLDNPLTVRSVNLDLNIIGLQYTVSILFSLFLILCVLKIIIWQLSLFKRIFCTPPNWCWHTTGGAFLKKLYYVFPKVILFTNFIHLDERTRKYIIQRLVHKMYKSLNSRETTIKNDEIKKL